MIVPIEIEDMVHEWREERWGGEMGSIDGNSIKRKLSHVFLSLFRNFLVSESRAHLWGGGNGETLFVTSGGSDFGKFRVAGSPARAEVPVGIAWRYKESAWTVPHVQLLGVLYFHGLTEVNSPVQEYRRLFMLSRLSLEFDGG
jgi:hypothetical protein